MSYKEYEDYLHKKMLRVYEDQFGEMPEDDKEEFFSSQIIWDEIVSRKSLETSYEKINFLEEECFSPLEIIEFVGEYEYNSYREQAAYEDYVQGEFVRGWERYYEAVVA